jgi:hypothetical protein
MPKRRTEPEAKCGDLCALRGCPFLILLALTLVDCGFYDSYQRAKQVRTYADLQTLARRIDQVLAEHSLSSAEAEGILQEVNDGRDAWGNRFIFRSKAVRGKFSYLLISLGSDRRLDVEDEGAYFTAPVSRVHGESEQDLVFRDGQAVTLAGK